MSGLQADHRGTEAQRRAMSGSQTEAVGAGRGTRPSVSPVCPRGVAVLLSAGALALGGCRGERSDATPRQFFPDMDDQARWDPQEQSPFFEDGRTMRPPPAGTVAFGRSPLDPAGAGNADWAETFRLERANFLQEDDITYHGGRLDDNGQVVEFVEQIPVPVTMAMLERGRERFNIYCSVCHGYTGDGRGMVGQQWITPLPSYYDPKYTTPDPTTNQWRDGYLFHVSRVGVIDVTGTQKMPGYAHALSVQDSWAIVAYIRALQRAHAGDLQDVPPAARQTLEQQRPAALPATTPAPAAPAPAGATPPEGGQ